MKLTEIQNEKRLLKFEKVAPEVYILLQDLKRTGWVDNGVENPESVKEEISIYVKLFICLHYQLYDTTRK